MAVVDFTRVPQLARNINRFGEIAGVLVKYGLADWLDKLDSKFLHRLLSKTSLEPLAGVSHEARIRLAFTELGTTFIKLGQMLSTRRDIVGPALANELSQLQSNVPADPFEVTRATVEAELRQPLAMLFAEFSETPLASASIGQVHRARLRDGHEVVVKVQHPNILKRVQNDLSILASLAELTEEYISELWPYRPVAVVAEFKKLLLRELDFRRELRHLQIFRRNFEKTPEIRIPCAIPEYSTSRVLTMEFLDGQSLQQCHDSGAFNDEVRKELAGRGARAFLDMIFRDGFFHADPHPGNILILEGNVIGLLDCGMVGRVDEALRRQIESGMLAVMNRDSAALTELIVQIGQAPPELDVAGLQAEVADQLAFYWGMPLDQFHLGSALDELTEAVRTYHVVLPPTISLLIKVLVMLEGTGRLLDPQFNLTGVLEGYRSQFTKRRLSPKRMVRRFMASVRDWDDVLQNLPRMVRDMMRFTREKRFAVQLQHQHLEPSVNRLVFGMMVCALFLGSAWLWAAKTPPEIYGVSVIGALGCFTSSVFGYRLFRAIQKSGKLEDR
jgi:ubiquinone biosynthesis protein